MRTRTTPYRGFTLIELLVVITIILIVSAVALSAVLAALSDRQVGEAARILHAAIAGARDAAIRNNAPSGFRLLPDPIFNGRNPQTGQLDSSMILASSRLIPIESAPAYTEGFASFAFLDTTSGLQIPYPGDGGGYYPLTPGSQGVLLLQECVYNPSLSTAIPNPPTSWFWNIRIGDKLQINQSGPWYTVVGPLNVTGATGNTELFVNVGQPGTQSPLSAVYAAGDQVVVYYPEFLLLVNGDDDNSNGWTDEGWDGIDNNGDGNTDELAEWELENWNSPFVSSQNFANLPYVIRRRPVPGRNAREVALPSNVVIDMTTWNTTRERSRLPVDRFGGYVDILINPDGSIAPSTVFSTPAASSLSSAFLHFWLAERRDLATPSSAVTSAPFLPLPQGVAPTLFGGLELRGPNTLVTIFTRSGNVSTNENPPFDNPTTPANGSTYSADFSFREAQQGTSGAP
jgi:prepilin-type N-terminal cleavage/methylation domain-containing protein